MATDFPLYLSRSDLEDCKCDDHIFEYNKKYKQLANKKYQSRKKISPTSSTLNISDRDEVMKSVYQTDYERSEYTPLAAEIRSLTGRPIVPAIANWKDAYRDPNRFKYSAMETPTIQPAETISLLKVPETVSFWDKPFTSISEYTDKISQLGLSNMKNQQQFLNPLLPMKSELGSCNF